MQIILVQSEIEQALKDYVNSQVNVKDGQEISIELKATRGTDGATAIIDILPSKQVAAKVATSVATPRTAVAISTTKAVPEAKDEPVAKTTATESNTSTAGEAPAFKPDEGAAEAAAPATTEEAAGEPVRKSLFSDLSRPTNK